MALISQRTKLTKQRLDKKEVFQNCTIAMKLLVDAMPAFLHFCVAFLSFTLENKDTHYAQNWFFVQIFILANLRSMRSFEAIKGHFRPVEVNRGHLRSMRPMEAIRGHLRPMMATWDLWGHLRLLSSFEVIEVIWNPNCLQSPKPLWTKIIILAQIKQIHFLLLSLWRFTLFLQSRKWNILKATLRMWTRRKYFLIRS